jgi:hypothetical protein
MTDDDFNKYYQDRDKNRINDNSKFAYLTDYAKMTDTLLIEQKKLSQAFLALLTEHLSLSGILSNGEVPIDMRDTQIQYMFDPTYTSAIFEQTISVQKTPDTTTYTIDMTYFTRLCNRFANRMVQYQPDSIVEKMPEFVQTMSAFHENKQNI